MLRSRLARPIDSRWIRAHRPPRLPVDPGRPFATHVEDEPTVSGEVASVGTIFLVNRECPFTCLMCDLWRYTTAESVPLGAVARQVALGLAVMPPVRHVKLYNAGNFFDDRAIAPDDRAAMLPDLWGLETVVIENHPRLVDARTVDYAARLEATRFEVAMGLETVAPHVIDRLNKKMTLDDFARATERLIEAGIGVRAFILLRPPFMTEAEGVEWAGRSITFALSVGVDCCVVVPTRAGNGALDALAASGEFAPPSLVSLETVLGRALEDRLPRRRVLADLWDIERLEACGRCRADRVARLRTMNLTQAVPEPVCCDCAE